MITQEAQGHWCAQAAAQLKRAAIGQSFFELFLAISFNEQLPGAHVKLVHHFDHLIELQKWIWQLVKHLRHLTM